MMKLRRYDEAVKDYSAALMFAVSDKNIISRRGLAYLAMGKIENAQVEFSKVLTIEQYDTIGLLGTGRIFFLQGNLKEAGSYFCEATIRDKTSPEAHFYYALWNYPQNQFFAADEALKKSEKLGFDRGSIGLWRYLLRIRQNPQEGVDPVADLKKAEVLG